jgi:hypothetical protein
MIEAEPVVDNFFADLEAQGHCPTHAERLALAEWIENHNLFPHQRQSWEKALRAFDFGDKYLSEGEKALKTLDRDDSITSGMIKKHFGTASPRVGIAVRSHREGR